MTISPPSNTSYGSTFGPRKAMTEQEIERDRAEALKRIAFYKTPEGQAAQAELIEQARKRAATWDEVCASLETDAKEDESSHKHKKHGKLFAKHGAKKSTGGILGLLGKMTKKG